MEDPSQRVFEFMNPSIDHLYTEEQILLEKVKALEEEITECRRSYHLYTCRCGYKFIVKDTTLAYVKSWDIDCDDWRTVSLAFHCYFCGCVTKFNVEKTYNSKYTLGCWNSIYSDLFQSRVVLYLKSLTGPHPPHNVMSISKYDLNFVVGNNSDFIKYFPLKGLSHDS